MSARRASLVASLLFCGLALAADDEIPDMAFLEYLGSWEESDEEWLIFADAGEVEDAEDEERSDPVPQGNESTETDDES